MFQVHTGGGNSGSGSSASGSTGEAGSGGADTTGAPNAGNNTTIRIKYKVMSCGRILVMYTPLVAGAHTLTIRYGQKLARGSPFTVLVSESDEVPACKNVIESRSTTAAGNISCLSWNSCSRRQSYHQHVLSLLVRLLLSSYVAHKYNYLTCD